MFSLLRRFSGSVIPRPDRPWDEDATSNAPQVGKKRRIVDDDLDEEEQARQKKARGETTSNGVDTPATTDGTPVPETKDVKEVTQGVEEVELDDKPKPESVPLPEEKDGELDADHLSTASTPPPATVDQENASAESPAPVVDDDGDLDAPTSHEPQDASPAVVDEPQSKPKATKPRSSAKSKAKTRPAPKEAEDPVEAVSDEVPTSDA
ncbi:hypothetical protein MIND_01192600 [Mycena indigotica]|uniref:Uncharacterized protein n=1 Tax=Mycena indigotica TaxID=2126181 RepID=A0A8H6S656_9AGAR|nr:uncharacterized protein MIND_01192600 [Mycena indigotica]KAF7292935.1 hypothetical protein MIND_01192600 [Mycena indigotica]